MGFCPRCKFEYQTDVLVCPDCKATIIDQLTLPGMAACTPDDSWVVVGGVSGEIEVHMAKGSLDSNNIPSMILPAKYNRLTARPNGPQSFRIGPSSGDMVMVPREFQEEALGILRAILGDDYDQTEIR